MYLKIKRGVDDSFYQFESSQPVSTAIRISTNFCRHTSITQFFVVFNQKLVLFGGPEFFRFSAINLSIQAAQNQGFLLLLNVLDDVLEFFNEALNCGFIQFFDENLHIPELAFSFLFGLSALLKNSSVLILLGISCNGLPPNSLHVPHRAARRYFSDKK